MTFAPVGLAIVGSVVVEIVIDGPVRPQGFNDMVEVELDVLSHRSWEIHLNSSQPSVVIERSQKRRRGRPVDANGVIDRGTASRDSATQGSLSRRRMQISLLVCRNTSSLCAAIVMLLLLRLMCK